MAMRVPYVTDGGTFAQIQPFEVGAEHDPWGEVDGGASKRRVGLEYRA